MNSDEPAGRDLFTRWLVAYDESLVGETTCGGEPETLDAETASRLRDAKQCLDLLERVRDCRGFSDSKPDVAAEPDPNLGWQLGRFQIERELGRGGLGVVLLGRDAELGRPVAIKVPRPDVLATQELQRRFAREAEAAARLNHPNLLPLFEVYRHEGQCVLVSEYCPGPNLSQWLASQSDPMSTVEAAQLVQSLAEAVQHAHSRGVLHRDIKPSNVMLDLHASEQGDEPQRLVPKLTDFGMAKLLEFQGDETRTGVVIGTPAYMAPEQADARGSQADVRTDVYALGAILYEVLTGRPPFRGVSDADTLRQLVSNDPTPPRNANRRVPRDLEAICLKCLARNPAHRYATAQELADDLGRFLTRQPTEARPLGFVGGWIKWSRRRPATAALVAVSFASVAAVLGVVVTYNLRLRDEVVRANAAQARAEGLLYSADVRLAHEALQANDVLRSLSLLNRQLPRAGQLDSREFAWRLLKQRCEPEALTLRGHAGSVYCVAYSPDGAKLATASADGTARIWDPNSGRLAQELRGHDDELTYLAFAPAGDVLATGSDDQTVRLWNVATGAPLRVLRGHCSGVLALAFSHNGAWLASGDVQGSVRVWDAATGDPVATLAEGTDAIQAIEFAENDGMLLAADQAETIHVWRTSNWTVAPRVWIDREKFFALAVNPRAHHIAAAGRREIIHLLELDWQGMKSVGQLRGGHREWIQSLAYSPTDEVLASGGKDAVIQLWDLSSRKVARTLLGHTGRVWSVAWSPNGTHLASSSDDKTAKVWSIGRDGGPTLGTAPERLFDVAFVTAEQEALGGGVGGRIRGWRLNTGDKTVDRPLSEQDICALRLSTDESLAATRFKDGTTQIWRRDTWTLIHSLPREGTSGSALAWIPGSRRVATTLDNATIGIVDADTGKVVQRFVQPNVVREVTFTPDGRRMLVSTQAALLVWDLSTQRHEFSVPQSCWGVVVSSDGRRAWLTEGSNVSAVDLDRGEVLSTMVTIGADASQLALSPDDRTLAVALQEPHLVSLWDVRTSQELLRLECDALHIHRVRFSRDGQRLLAAGIGADGQGRVWQWKASANP